MKNPFTLLRNSTSRTSMILIITAAVLIELTAVVQFYFSQVSIREEVRNHANLELDVLNQRIMGEFSEVSTVLSCLTTILEENLDQPESLGGIMAHIINDRTQIINCAAAFVPDYFPHHHLFEPIAMRNPNGTVSVMQGADDGHDYLTSDLFVKTLQCDTMIWSEPYLSSSGRREKVVSCSVALHDRSGRRIGAICADLSLNWLNDFANRTPVFASSKITMLTGEGRLLVYPYDTTKVMSRTVQEYDDGRDPSATELLNRMMAGKKGEMDIKALNGDTWLAFYTPVEGPMDWSIAITGDKGEIYKTLKRMQVFVLLLMLAGVLLMGFIVNHSAKNLQRLQSANERQQLIMGELQAARSIQQGMLPKQSPPFPDRDDVDICGYLLPAKEVGGDLFDYFIRDEKLFFCVGDVSGKGVPSSLMMAVARATFRTLSVHEAHPARIVELMNKALGDTNDQSLFVTFFLGVLDLPTGRLRYCNAGHDVPLLLDGGKAEPLPVKPNLPLGVVRNFVYEGQELLLSPQATLFLYTDGLTEAMDASHQLFGITRTTATANSLLTREPALSAADIVQAFDNDLQAFVAGAEQSDDLTMLAVRFTPQSHSLRLCQHIVLTNNVQEVTRLNDFTGVVTELLSIAPAEALQIKLAIEEAVVNVIDYAYPHGTTGEIAVEAQADDTLLRFIITDSGTPFDPTTRETADITLSAEDRPIGGLGILLVRQYMDSINYERSEGQNVLTLQKKLT